MTKRQYSLAKTNRIEIKIIDSKAANGVALLTINKDLYIKLLESGARGFMVHYMPDGKHAIAYRRGLGIRINTIHKYVAMAQNLRLCNKRINLDKKRETA